MPATPYDGEDSSAWGNGYAGGQDGFDATGAPLGLPGLPAAPAAGGSPGRGDSFGWHPGDDPADAGQGGPDDTGTAVWPSGQPVADFGGPERDFPGARSGMPGAGHDPRDEAWQREATQFDPREDPRQEPRQDPPRDPRREPPRDPRRRGERQRGPEQFPGGEPSRQPSPRRRRGEPDPGPGRPDDSFGQPETGGHPEWAGDDQHPGFFQGFGNDEGVDPPRRRRGRFAAPLISIIVILVLVLGAGGYLLHIYQARHANYSGPGAGKVTVQVKPGETAIGLAPELVSLGVIKATDPFVAAAKDSSNPDGLEPGTFSLRKHMNAAQAWSLLLDPKSRIQTKVTLQEGLRLTSILASLAKQTGKPLSDFQKALADTSALGLPSFAHGKAEGYLFPDTYNFPPGTTPLKMLQTMVAQFKTEAASLHLAAAAKSGHLTESAVIIQASILGEEVGEQDFGKVARVIDNRLNDHMTLGLDSTIEYALGITGHINLTEKQLAVDSPYNTRLHTGLPPGPIGSPGLAAIRAVLHPPKGPWLYFVTVDPKKGVTKFATTNAQFQVLVQELNKNLRNGT
jgi:UPF0755 protein